MDAEILRALTQLQYIKQVDVQNNRIEVSDYSFTRRGDWTFFKRMTDAEFDNIFRSIVKKRRPRWLEEEP